jgi:hypothetical protein
MGHSRFTRKDGSFVNYRACQARVAIELGARALTHADTMPLEHQCSEDCWSGSRESQQKEHIRWCDVPVSLAKTATIRRRFRPVRICIQYVSNPLPTLPFRMPHGVGVLTCLLGSRSPSTILLVNACSRQYRLFRKHLRVCARSQNPESLAK